MLIRPYHDEEVETFDRGSYRHREVCYHCNAIGYVEEDADDDQQPLLYTNWGRDAAYRAEQLASIASQAIQHSQPGHPA